MRNYLPVRGQLDAGGGPGEKKKNDFGGKKSPTPRLVGGGSTRPTVAVKSQTHRAMATSYGEARNGEPSYGFSGSDIARRPKQREQKEGQEKLKRTR